MKWKLRSLSEVALIGSGAGFPTVDQGKTVGDFPFLKVSDMNLSGNEISINRWNNMVTESVRSRLRAKAFPSGSVIFPKIGAAIGTNKKRLLNRPCCIDNNVMAITPNPHLLDQDFLYYLLLTKNLSDFASDSNPPSIRKSVVEDWKIPVPPLADQRHIADVLARAQGIIKLRLEAVEKSKVIMPALLVELLGDPATNPKNWPLRSVRDLVARFEGGKNLQAAGEGSTEFKILKVSAVTSGRYVETESKPTPENYAPPANHVIRMGDMLFSRANTEHLVGATAIVRATNGRTLLPDKLWRFIWSEPVDQDFMHALFQSAYVRKQLAMLSSGTSASMRNISQAKLFCLKLPIPPLEKQRSFSIHFNSVISIQAQQAVALKNSLSTFEGLLAKFIGSDFDNKITETDLVEVD